MNCILTLKLSLFLNYTIQRRRSQHTLIPMSTSEVTIEVDLEISEVTIGASLSRGTSLTT
jgi:hypothetical protein